VQEVLHLLGVDGAALVLIELIEDGAVLRELLCGE